MTRSRADGSHMRTAEPLPDVRRPRADAAHAEGPARPSPDRVVLHVGSPKSATTYLQHRLALNAAHLADQGVVLPRGRGLHHPLSLHYRAALDLRGMRHGRRGWEVDGRWDELVGRIRRSDGVRLVSHEVFAGATREQARQAVADLDGLEVHVVVSATDLGRQLAGGWQESVKHGGVRSFGEFLEAARRRELPLMRDLNLRRVFEVWGAELPAERLHLVTVPRASSQRSLPWERFAAALGIDPASAPREPNRDDRVNASLGVAQTRLLRELNQRLGESVRRGGRYHRIVQEVLVRRGLRTTPQARIELDPAHHEWVRRTGERWQRWIRQRGVQVHGDLADLIPVAMPAERWVDPDANRLDAMDGVGVGALAELLAEVDRRGRPTWWAQDKVRRVRRRLRRPGVEDRDQDR
ncbi:MAG: hypothetical protein QM638_11695 [Nocardioides sp.]|uniref:hypothetical protein n=1 Tax=Nocardioides sp. TaxID=35761 RepID=UPI0039E420C4